MLTSGQYREEHQIARVDLRPVAPIFREAEFEKLFEEKPAAKPGDKETGRGGDKETTALPQAASAAPAEEKSSGDQQPTDMSTASEQLKSPISNLQIEFEGIERRLRFLTPPQMDAVAQAISPDSRDLLFTATVADKVNVWSLALDEARHELPPRQLTYTRQPSSAPPSSPPTASCSSSSTTGR